MFRRLSFLLFLSGSVLGGPAVANDSTAELKTSGLVLVRSDVIGLDREDLFISMDEIRVAYRFTNSSNRNVDTIVAFPMPDIEFDPFADTALPDATNDNFLDFSAAIDGRPADVTLEQRAFAAGLDVSGELKSHGVPLFPFGDAVIAALKAQSPATLADWEGRGLVYMDQYDAGQGMQIEPTPAWSLKSTYWWKMVFPAGQTIAVEHRYKPSLGGTAGVSFYSNGRFEGEAYQDYRERYCMDAGFERAIERVTKAKHADYPPFYETRIAYVLTSGANWSGGTIKTFHLTVDKGSPDNFVSFCGQNLKKTGPTTFESTQTDFFPERDLEVLILQPANFQ